MTICTYNVALQPQNDKTEALTNGRETSTAKITESKNVPTILRAHSRAGIVDDTG